MGHMSRDHITNPALNTEKGITSNFRKPATSYKATTPSNRAAQKVHAIMAELNDEDLAEAKTAFIESLDNDGEPAEEEPEGF